MPKNRPRPAKPAPPVKVAKVAKAKPADPASPAVLRARLDALGAALAETARRHVARLQGEIDAVAEALPGLGAKDRARIARRLAALTVKPRKGRRKDLKKIDLLIGELQELSGK